MAKHRRKKSESPVDYGIILTVAVVIAGALVLVRRVRAIQPTGWGVVVSGAPPSRHH